MAATYEYDAHLVSANGSGLAFLNTQGAEGWKVILVMKLQSNIRESIPKGNEEMLVLFERVIDRDFIHLIAALEEMFERITLATSQD